MTPELITLAVVAGRFLLPLLIIRYPLPAIVACLLLDGVDQTIFQALGESTAGYQGYDKAMDVFYLAMAYVAMLRNWTSPAAFAVGRLLYLYRLLGVVVFELTDWRPVLVIAPNTFEYFFIAYELIRTRWDPSRYSMRFWVWLAAGIWVLIKIPQETWIHLLELDLTDELARRSWLAPVLVALVFTYVALIWTRFVPRLGPTAWTPRLRADAMPLEVDEPWERETWLATHGRIRSMATMEKVVLVGLICMVFGQVLPGFRVNAFELFVSLGIFVVINAALALWAARNSRTRSHLLASFASRLVFNIALVLVANAVFGASDVNLTATFFFIAMLCLLTTLHDRYWPVHSTWVEHARAGVRA